MNGIYLAEGLALIIDIDVTIVVSFYLSSIYLIYLSLFYNILLAGFPPNIFFPLSGIFSRGRAVIRLHALKPDSTFLTPFLLLAHSYV